MHSWKSIMKIRHPQIILLIFHIGLGINSFSQTGDSTLIIYQSVDTIHLSGVSYDRIQTEGDIYYLLQTETKLMLDSLIEAEFRYLSSDLEIYSYQHPLVLPEYSFTTDCQPIYLNAAIKQYLVSKGVDKELITVKNCSSYPLDPKNEHQDEIYFIVKDQGR